MPVAKSLGAQIGNATSKLLAASAEVAIVEDRNASVAKELERRNLVAEIARQASEATSSADAKAIAMESNILVEANSGARNRALVPRTIPSWMIPIDPGILSMEQKCSTEESNYECCAFHSISLRIAASTPLSQP